MAERCKIFIYVFFSNLGGGVIKAFDIRSNVKNMLKPSDELHVLYGIKVVSMCVAVVVHQVGMFNGGPISNGANFDKVIFIY